MMSLLLLLSFMNKFSSNDYYYYNLKYIYIWVCSDFHKQALILVYSIHMRCHCIPQFTCASVRECVCRCQCVLFPCWFCGLIMYEYIIDIFYMPYTIVISRNLSCGVSFHYNEHTHTHMAWRSVRLRPHARPASSAKDAYTKSSEETKRWKFDSCCTHTSTHVWNMCCMWCVCVRRFCYGNSQDSYLHAIIGIISILCSSRRDMHMCIQDNGDDNIF